MITCQTPADIHNLLRGECQQGSDLLDRDVQPHFGLRWTSHAVQWVSIQDPRCVGPSRHGSQHANSRPDRRIWPTVGSPLIADSRQHLGRQVCRPSGPDPIASQKSGSRPVPGNWLTAAIRDRFGATPAGARPPKCPAARALESGAARPSRPNARGRPQLLAGRRAP